MRLRITHLTERGNGVAKHGGSTYELPFVLRGETTSAKEIKKVKHHVYALPFSIGNFSPLRKKPDCIHFGTCGACHFRHLTFRDSIILKKEGFLEMLRKEIKKWDTLDTLVYDNMRTKMRIKTDKESLYYRNQSRFYRVNGALCQKEMLTHAYFPITECKVISKDAMSLALFLHKKLPQEITEFELRENDKKEVMCIFSGTKIVKLPTLPVHSGYFYDTEKKTYTHIMGEKTLLQKISIQEKVFSFQMGPDSFFQVNTGVASMLYQHAISLLPTSGTVWDYFSGTGTIGIIAAAIHPEIKVKSIEIREEMVTLAKANAKLNKIKNISFEQSNLHEISLKGSPDAILLDPPRNGLGKHLRDELLSIASPSLIYISCNAATFFEDMRDLSTKYELKSLMLYEMMPFTSHLEILAQLKLKG